MNAAVARLIAMIGFRWNGRAVYIRGGFLFTGSRKQKHISLCRLYYRNSIRFFLISCSLAVMICPAFDESARNRCGYAGRTMAVTWGCVK